MNNIVIITGRREDLLKLQRKLIELHSYDILVSVGEGDEFNSFDFEDTLVKIVIGISNGRLIKKLLKIKKQHIKVKTDSIEIDMSNASVEEFREIYEIITK